MIEIRVLGGCSEWWGIWRREGQRRNRNTGLRKRRMARRESIIENSVCIVEGQDGGSAVSELGGEFKLVKIAIYENVDQLN